MLKLLRFLLAAYIPVSLSLAAANNDLLQIHFIDVGQGDAIWIQGPAGECTPEGLNMIIDGGPDSGAKNRLMTYLNAYKLPENSIVDYAVITHPHNDHFPGMIDVLKKYQVRTIIDSGFPDIGAQYRSFLDAAKAETVGAAKSTLIEMRKQPQFQFPACTGDLRLSIAYADTDQPGLGSGGTRVNNASTVIRIVYKNFSFLFMGDLEGKGRNDSPEKLSLGEAALLRKAGDGKLQSTVLKVGHHGSETSSTLALIRAVKPEVVVIESGRKPYSGTFLPDKSVIERYRKEVPRALIVRTDEGDEAEKLDTITDADGDDIAIITDGDSLRVRQAKMLSGKRRWVTVKKIQK